MPVIVCNLNREVIWYNKPFSNSFNVKNIFGANLDRFSKSDLDDFCSCTGIEFEYENKFFRAYGVKVAEENYNLYMIYFCDITELKNSYIKYQLSKPCVLILLIDNYDEAFQNVKESDKSQVFSQIDKVLENFIGETTGFIKMINRNKFISVIEQRHLNIMIEKKFPLLEKIREIVVNNTTKLTLSIGIATNNENFFELETAANQALDMALGRGGDQVAINNNNSYEFFGGLSSGTEKHTKVKTRMAANAMTELIQTSENIIVMGHAFSDLDCVGSAIGIASAIKSIGKQVYIAINKEKSLSKSLIEYAENNSESIKEMFLEPKATIEKVNQQTLLIIVDTHNPDFIESFELYEKCKNIIVIDHHRKMVNYIKNSVIFYHEPYASSTSEIVTELIQYFGEQYKISKIEAECLLAGIMLDTKNFVMRTGIRTFEAAAYLKKLGCDNVNVKKLFSTSIESYKLKTELVSSAEVYKNCAITYCEISSPDIRIVSAQAADELLGISNVNASFVIFKDGEQINISARSMGAINVQLIMEQLGGGGHQNMAACQLNDVSLEKAIFMLYSSIDKLFEKI